MYIFVEEEVLFPIRIWYFIIAKLNNLGILLDSKLTFVLHIKGYKKKCVKVLNLLRVVSNTDWVGNSTVLLQLYRPLVQSKLNYGCFIYGTAHKSYTCISLLDPIQN